LIDDLGADEFDIIELAVAIQEATGKTISSEDEANVKTVGDFIKLVEA
jgi:acyl carrier protein